MGGGRVGSNMTLPSTPCCSPSPHPLVWQVSMEGLPADVDERRLDVRPNKFSPSWDEVELEFPLVFPELALICFEVSWHSYAAW